MPKPKPEDFLNLLGNKHRRRIIQLCSIRPLYPQKIAEILGITVPAVIKHLQELEKSQIIVKKTEPRAEGGRDIQYYYVPFRPRFKFNQASNDLVDIEIIDESDKSIPETHSRDKLVSRNAFNENELSSIKENYKILAKHEQDKVEAFRKLRQIQFEEGHFFRNIQVKNSSQQRILFKIIRFLLERYGLKTPFTNQDLEVGLGIDENSVKEIIQLLSEDVQIITKDSPDSWMLNSFENKDQMDYT